MSDIFKALADLSEDDIRKVLAIVKEMSDEEEQVETEEEPPQENPKQKRKHSQRGRKHRRGQEPGVTKERVRGRRPPKSKTLMRTSEVETQGDRPNLFFDKGWNKLERDIYTHDEQARRDLEIAEKIKSKQLQVSERRESSLIEVQCRQCMNWFDVSPTLVTREDGEYRYSCNDCQTNRM